ncbi:hypothetical protein D3C85_1639890 [compost metagenome]
MVLANIRSTVVADSRSVRAGPVPLYGMLTMSVFVASLNCSAARCRDEPWPPIANVSLPGFFLA